MRKFDLRRRRYPCMTRLVKLGIEVPEPCGIAPCIKDNAPCLRSSPSTRSADAEGGDGATTEEPRGCAATPSTSALQSGLGSGARPLAQAFVSPASPHAGAQHEELGDAMEGPRASGASGTSKKSCSRGGAGGWARKVRDGGARDPRESERKEKLSPRMKHPRHGGFYGWTL